MVTHGLNPYNSKIELTDQEVENIVDTAFEEWGFQNSDAIVLHGAPSKRDEKRRFQVFEETVKYLETVGRTPELYFPEDKKYLLENSDIKKDDITGIKPDITEDDISMSGTYESRIHVTSDYNANRADRLLNEYEADCNHDYLVLSAYTGDLDSITDMEIGGKTVPITHEIAEVNEVRRKLQGSRF